MLEKEIGIIQRHNENNKNSSYVSCKVISVEIQKTKDRGKKSSRFGEAT